MNKEKTFLKLPIHFKKDIYIYPPTVNEVVGNDKFPIYNKLLTQTQEEIEDDFVEQKQSLDKIPTPFQYIFAYAAQNQQCLELVQDAFSFFLKTKVSLLADVGMIVVGDLEALVTSIKDVNDIPSISADEFFDFQNIVRESVGQKPAEKPDSNMHPKVKAMKAKARYRDKIKAKSGKGISFYTSLISLCCMGIGITPLNVGELSYAAIADLIAQWQAKDSYETSVRSLQAGASPKKVKPKYWIRNLDE